jgi:integrase/recombinase XerD
MKIKDVIPVYLQHMRIAGRSPLTIRAVRYDLQAFLRFLEGEKIFHIEDLSADILCEYQEELSFHLTAKGSLLSLAAQSRVLTMIRGFTRFLKEKDYLLYDPGDSIKLPKKSRRLPRVILSQGDVRHLLNAQDTRTNKGYRDRVILEILYDTGIRRAEISEIKTGDMDLKAGYILVHGKGNKDRVVPLSKRVCEMTRSYILAVRPCYINGDDPGYLILSYQGKRMGERGIWKTVKYYAHAAGIKKNVTTHTLRHTCATHMLKNGAPVRHLQEMLGHESLDSTQIYTRVTINDLKEIHAKYHPSETMDNTSRT